MVIIHTCSFHSKKSEHDFYRGEDSKFAYLKEHATEK